MMGIGGFSPITYFMDKADWKSVCEKMMLKDGTFWPVPVTLSVSVADADAIKIGQEIALESAKEGEIMAVMTVSDKFSLTKEEKKWECKKVFKGAGPDSADDKFWETAKKDHPGVQMVHRPSCPCAWPAR